MMIKLYIVQNNTIIIELNLFFNLIIKDKTNKFKIKPKEFIIKVLKTLDLFK